MKFTIKGTIAGANEYIRACRSNSFQANKFKKNEESYISYFLPKEKLDSSKSYELNIVWYEKDKRRDVDNVAFGVKFILDAMVAKGILQDDSQRFVAKVNNTVLVDKNNPRVEVEIIERV